MAQRDTIRKLEEEVEFLREQVRALTARVTDPVEVLKVLNPVPVQQAPLDLFVEDWGPVEKPGDPAFEVPDQMQAMWERESWEDLQPRPDNG